MKNSNSEMVGTKESSHANGMTTKRSANNKHPKDSKNSPKTSPKDAKKSPLANGISSIPNSPSSRPSTAVTSSPVTYGASSTDTLSSEVTSKQPNGESRTSMDSLPSDNATSMYSNSKKLSPNGINNSNKRPLQSEEQKTPRRSKRRNTKDNDNSSANDSTKSTSDQQSINNSINNSGQLNEATSTNECTMGDSIGKVVESTNSSNPIAETPSMELKDNHSQVKPGKLKEILERDPPSSTIPLGRISPSSGSNPLIIQEIPVKECMGEDTEESADEPLDESNDSASASWNRMRCEIGWRWSWLQLQSSELKYQLEIAEKEYSKERNEKEKIVPLYNKEDADHQSLRTAGCTKPQKNRRLVTRPIPPIGPRILPSDARQHPLFSLNVRHQVSLEDYFSDEAEFLSTEMMSPQTNASSNKKSTPRSSSASSSDKKSSTQSRKNSSTRPTNSPFDSPTPVHRGPGRPPGSGSRTPRTPQTPSSLKNKGLRTRDFDIDSIVIPFSMSPTIIPSKPVKEIHTPRWQIIEDPMNSTHSNEDVTSPKLTSPRITSPQLSPPSLTETQLLRNPTAGAGESDTEEDDNVKKKKRKLEENSPPLQFQTQFSLETSFNYTLSASSSMILNTTNSISSITTTTTPSDLKPSFKLIESTDDLLSPSQSSMGCNILTSMQNEQSELKEQESTDQSEQHASDEDTSDEAFALRHMCCELIERKRYILPELSTIPNDPHDLPAEFFVCEGKENPLKKKRGPRSRNQPFQDSNDEEVKKWKEAELNELKTVYMNTHHFERNWEGLGILVAELEKLREKQRELAQLKEKERLREKEEKKRKRKLDAQDREPDRKKEKLDTSAERSVEAEDEDWVPDEVDSGDEFSDVDVLLWEIVPKEPLFTPTGFPRNILRFRRIQSQLQSQCDNSLNISPSESKMDTDQPLDNPLTDELRNKTKTGLFVEIPENPIQSTIVQIPSTPSTSSTSIPNIASDASSSTSTDPILESKSKDNESIPEVLLLDTLTPPSMEFESTDSSSLSTTLTKEKCQTEVSGVSLGGTVDSLKAAVESLTTTL